MTRCPWGEANDLYIKYHDEEWGVPVHDDRKLFEFLTLEAAQAGLSWLTILRKRENYRKAYNRFYPLRVSRYDDKDITRLLQNEGIVRNHKKIEASVNNARKFMEIKKEFGSFDNYIWRFVDYTPVVNRWRDVKAIPSKSALSDQISEDLIKRGFRFIGSTILYAYLQAVGIVNDHIVSCFRYPQIISLSTQPKK
jgi:DNA-3-methyladenine glycosylase I